MNTETTAVVRRSFVADLGPLQARFLMLADAIPEEEYCWRPAPGVRSIGETFLHVASQYHVDTLMAYGLAASPVVPRQPGAMAQFAKASTRADVLKHLSDGFTDVRGQIAGADVNALSGTRTPFDGDHTIAETTRTMSADLHEHLGRQIALARMHGMKPPMTK